MRALSRSRLRPRLLTALLAALLSVSVGAAWAAPETLAKAGVNVTLPEGWTAQPDAGGLVVMSPDQAVTVTLLPVASYQLQAALEALESTLQAQFKDLTIGAPTETVVHGMAGIHSVGTGTMDGTPVAIQLLMLQAPQSRLIVLSLMPAALAPRWAKPIDGLIASLAPSPEALLAIELMQRQAAAQPASTPAPTPTSAAPKGAAPPPKGP